MSKWTAVNPSQKELHFIVVELIKDSETDEIIACVLEAVINKNTYEVDWQVLKNAEEWLMGWK